jgi:hypothetical protein
MVFVTFAVTAGMPKNVSMGKVISVPPPAATAARAARRK